MPIHLDSQSRRRFLQNLSATSAAVALSTTLRADESTTAMDDRFFALLSDTHISASPDGTARGINMTDNLKSVISDIAGLEKRPANLIINGDCALSVGSPGEYQNFANCVAPLDELGIHLHLTMGNHDDRETLYEHFAKARPTAQPVPVKHVGVLEGEFANWFLIDTLIRPGHVAGEVGYEQMIWLTKELDARPDKPAIVMGHHTLQFTPPKPGARWTGLWDTDALVEALQARPHVRALFYGHSHVWKTETIGNLQLINLPAVSYVFSEEIANGWVSAHLDEHGMKLQFHTMDPKHPQNGTPLEVVWG
ncbi:3',5'-cyclic adenosine monophosphate phosphodiesterase CpdA [Novipirellula galeiformis]|uniref:3',5'-cyclic adenosine monophosphate phosphodiesterase CpdA n=1 Tax=Novipirellula galeiformis TaxID=2528004 RepID=A0A5C6C0Q0_9BACT|nr:metallophosphoesterase [Novipirellula galeiformis]TWU17682.1 3',5'-cyclic adenosine monophosphate phosphodiesterase CpdA [Novipirellula galeiformis]